MLFITATCTGVPHANDDEKASSRDAALALLAAMGSPTLDEDQQSEMFEHLDDYGIVYFGLGASR